MTGFQGMVMCGKEWVSTISERNMRPRPDQWLLRRVSESICLAGDCSYLDLLAGHDLPDPLACEKVYQIPDAPHKDIIKEVI